MVIKIRLKVVEVAGKMRELHRAQRRHESSARCKKVERVESAAAKNRRAAHERV